MPTCERCNRDVPEKLLGSQFGKGQKTLKMCRECIRWRNLFVNYGLTEEQYEDILRAQRYCCAICSRPEQECKRSGPGGKPGLVVDHKHGTRVVRGLLCHHCNTLVGYANESVEILIRAIEYLRGQNGLYPH